MESDSDDIDPGKTGSAKGDPAKSHSFRNDPIKKLMWSGLMAGTSTVVAVVANRAASAVWRRVFDEEPPE
jgi:hypothetical protein